LHLVCFVCLSDMNNVYLLRSYRILQNALLQNAENAQIVTKRVNQRLTFDQVLIYSCL